MIAFQYEMYDNVEEDFYVFNPQDTDEDGEMRVRLVTHEEPFVLAKPSRKFYGFVSHFERLVARDLDR